VAIKAIHFAVTKPGVLVLIVSPGIRQSMIMFNRITKMMFDNPVLAPTISRYTKTEIHLNNGSQITALPCVLPDERIITKEGVKLAKNIKVGDMLLTHEGRYRPTIQRFETPYSGPVITFNTGDRKLTVTPEHPILATINGEEMTWHSAIDLHKAIKGGNSINFATPRHPITSPSLNIPETDKAYIAGLIECDGHFSIHIKKHSDGGLLCVPTIGFIQDLNRRHVVEWMHSLFGGELFINEEAHSIRLLMVGKKRTLSVLNTIEPYLKMKREQAAIVRRVSSFRWSGKLAAPDHWLRTLEYKGELSRINLRNNPQMLKKVLSRIERLKGEIEQQNITSHIERHSGNVYNWEVEEDNSYCASSFVTHNCSQDGATLRGYTADLVILDEAAFMPETVISNVIFPMLATTETTRGTGNAILISTPWGRNHIFYRMTLNKKYFYRHVKSHESPLIKQSFLDDQRKEIGDLRYRIEYEAEFVEDATSLFTQSIIRGMIEDKYYSNRTKKDKPPLLRDVEVIKIVKPIRGEHVMGLDIGKRRDYTVLTVWKKASRRVSEDLDDEIPRFGKTNVPTKTVSNAYMLVYMKRFDLKTSYNKEVIPFVKMVYSKFNVVGGFIDQSGVGEAVVEELESACPNLRGIILNIRNKHEVMMWYYGQCERLKIGIPDDRVIIAEHLEQNFGYSTKKVKSIEEVLSTEGAMRFWHPEGRNDDILWSCALAIFATHGGFGEWVFA
jgi:hypothetical protein